MGADEPANVVKEFANDPFGVNNLMMTPDMPIMDSPQRSKDKVRQKKQDNDKFNDENIKSENHSQASSGSVESYENEIGLAAPASAEKQIKIFQKVTRIRNLHSGKKT